MPRPVTVGNGCGGAAFVAPSWVYHSLPRSSLSERIRLVILVWWGQGLPTITVSHACLGTTHWGFWFGGLTVYHCLPSPGSGSAPAVLYLYQSLPPRTRDRVYTHIDIHIVASIGHRVAGWATVITVDNGGGWRTHSERGRHHAGRYRKENFRIIRPVG